MNKLNEQTNVLHYLQSIKLVLAVVMIAYMPLARGQQQPNVLLLLSDNRLQFDSIGAKPTLFNSQVLITDEINKLSSIEATNFDTENACPMEEIEPLQVNRRVVGAKG